MTMTTPPAIRLKSQWFRPGAPKTPEQQAGAMGFITWRVALQMLKRMRGVDFDIDAGTTYFDFLREVLVFLVLVVDRIAHARLDGEARARFTAALVRHVADTLQGNEHDLLGAPPPGQPGSAERFIDLFNELGPHYAEFGSEPGADETLAGFMPDFGFVRYLGRRLEPTLPPKDQRWVLDQVMAVEAPEAVALVQRSMRELYADAPRRPRRSSMTGE
jgi:hypothetical protein